MPFIKRLVPAFLAVLCFVTFTLALQAQNTTAAASTQASSSAAQQMYHRAWQLVRDTYYQTAFNGQDWSTWEHKFDGKLNSPDAAYDATRQMLSSLNDPYTRFLDPKAYKEEDDAINSVVCGIGISLKPYADAHALIVNEVIEHGPAEGAGIKYGDQIVAIDGTATLNIDTDKAAEKIRGKAGTAVQLTIKRNADTKLMKITREEINIPAVSAKILPANIGYIKLATFMSDDASTEFKQALEKLSSCQGLILDLRDNPGGLLANAIEIADMLLDRGNIVTTVSRKGKFTDAASRQPINRQPLVLIVDKDSASASEILAGALKDNGRATILGTRTFGKGLVQEINRLPGGAGIHVTVARYFTPNGSDINKIGITPDISVDDRDRQLSRALEVVNGKIASANQQTGGNRDEILTLSGKRPPGARTISPRT